jgi:hypothetical protein
MEELEQIKSDLAQIKKRNQKVETDKAWETSYARRFLLVAFTYLSISIYMVAIKVDRPWLNAIVPAIGFTLSTLALPYFKNLWIKYKK